MRTLIPLLMVLTFAVPAAASEMRLVRIQPIADASGHEARMANLSPGLRTWVSAEARTTLDSGTPPDADVIADAVQARLVGQDFSNGDIETLVQLVMMECTRQADAELREMMEQMRATNKRKARMRQAAAAQNNAKKELSTAARAEYAGPSGSPPAEAESAADSMSEMGEMDQLRLQMLMDRRSKAMETLSNLMKKQSDTASTITSNLK